MRSSPMLLFHSPSQLDRGEKTLKSSWVRLRTERDYSPITIMGRTGLAWKTRISFITNQISVGQQGKKKRKKKPQLYILKHLSSTSPLYLRDVTSVLNSLFPPSDQCTGTKNCSLGQFTHFLWHSFLLKYFLCSDMDSLPWGTAFHDLHQQRLQLFTNCFRVHSIGYSPSGRHRSSVNPPKGHKPSRNLLQCGLLSLHRFVCPARSLPQHGLLMGPQHPSGASTCSGVGFCTKFRWVSAPLWTSMDCRGTACLPHCGLH